MPSLLRGRFCARARLGDLPLVLLATAFFVLTLLYVDLAGNFPLNDDWAYAQTALRLMTTGRFLPIGWVSMPLITHVTWGVLFCLAAGFSFTTLRISTLSLAWLTLVLTYVFARRLLHAPRSVAFIASIVVAFNPLHYVLAFTFMTDVSSAALMLASAFFFARHLALTCTRDLIFGTLLAAAATLSRQTGLAIPLAFAISAFASRRLSVGRFVRAGAPLAACTALLIGFDRWLITTGRAPQMYRIKTEVFPPSIGQASIFFSDHVVVSLVYLGLFVLPVALPALTAMVAGRTRRELALFVGGWAAMVTVLGSAISYRASFGHPSLMPLIGNILTPSGVGTPTLRDILLLHREHLPPLPHRWWQACTYAGIAGGASIVLLLGDAVRSHWRRRRKLGRLTPDGAIGLFCAVAAFLVVAPTLPLPNNHFYDRYLIPSVPLLVLALLAFYGKRLRLRAGRATAGAELIAWVVVASLAWVGVAGTHDYMTWNRIRWQAVRELVHDDGVPIEQIDGGFEVNGWFLYSDAYQRERGKSWWWVHEDKYLITFGNLRGYRILRRYPYRTVLPPGSRAIYVLKKRRRRSTRGRVPGRHAAAGHRQRNGRVASP